MQLNSKTFNGNQLELVILFRNFAQKGLRL